MTMPTIARAPDAGADLIDLIYRRRSVRAYKMDPIDEGQLQILLDAAVRAPTAKDEEPWRFIVVQNRAVLTRLSDDAKAAARAEAARRGDVLKAPGSPGDGIASPFADPTYNIFYDAGTLVVIAANPTGEFVAADCWLAAENLMLAACAEGLGACCIGLALTALNAPQTKAELGIPMDVQAFVAVIVGVPNEEAPSRARRPAVTLSWIR
jgi:nitroreductase